MRGRDPHCGRLCDRGPVLRACGPHGHVGSGSRRCRSPRRQAASGSCSRCRTGRVMSDDGTLRVEYRLTATELRTFRLAYIQLPVRIAWVIAISLVAWFFHQAWENPGPLTGAIFLRYLEAGLVVLFIV